MQSRDTAEIDPLGEFGLRHAILGVKHPKHPPLRPGDAQGAHHLVESGAPQTGDVMQQKAEITVRIEATTRHRGEAPPG